jgi:hypothetical protein
MCFDVLCDDDPLVGLEVDALQKRIKSFMEMVAVQANQTKGRDVMLTMGSDFQYSQARKNFQNLDLLIVATDYVLSNGSIQMSDLFGEDRFNSVKIFYSTPERYTECKYIDLMNTRKARQKSREQREPLSMQTKFESTLRDSNNWAVKMGDWFPYADCDHCYWTGYFSSRQSLKRLERVGSSFLHASRQIESMLKLQFSHLDGAYEHIINKRDPAGRSKLAAETLWSESLSNTNSWNDSPLYTLDDAMGVAQHHDAVSGTSKQHVAYDYAKRIADGMKNASAFVTDALRAMLVDSSAISFSYCHLLNETVCDISQVASEDDTQSTYVVVYNALTSNRSEVIPLPVSVLAMKVERLASVPDDWAVVASTVIANANYANVNVADAAGYTLWLEARDLPPTGALVFRITRSEERHDPASTVRIANEVVDEATISLSHLRSGQNNGELASVDTSDLVFSNGVLSVTFDR